MVFERRASVSARGDRGVLRDDPEQVGADGRGDRVGIDRLVDAGDDHAADPHVDHLGELDEFRRVSDGRVVGRGHEDRLVGGVDRHDVRVAQPRARVHHDELVVVRQGREDLGEPFGIGPGVLREVGGPGDDLDRLLRDDRRFDVGVSREDVV